MVAAIHQLKKADRQLMLYKPWADGKTMRSSPCFLRESADSHTPCVAYITFSEKLINHQTFLLPFQNKQGSVAAPPLPGPFPFPPGVPGKYGSRKPPALARGHVKHIKVKGKKGKKVKKETYDLIVNIDLVRWSWI